MPVESIKMITKTIRRRELREMVPLADSTIFEMEKRGEFPRRFTLAPRCVVWDFDEVQKWLNARRANPPKQTVMPRPNREKLTRKKLG